MLYLAVFVVLLALAALPVVINGLRRREPLPDLTHEDFDRAHAASRLPERDLKL